MEKYVIINASEVSSVDFSLVRQTSADTIRYSLDRSLALVSFTGNTPSFLNGKTTYTYQEILTETAKSTWEDDSQNE
jgi:hypothetical protein